MATGQPAFPRSTTAVVFDAILNRTPAQPSQLNPNLPPKMDEIIGKALEKDRELRYQSAAELRADLKRLKRDTDSLRVAASGSAAVSVARSGQAPPEPSEAAGAISATTAAPRGRHPVLWVAGALLVAGIAAGAALLLHERFGHRDFALPIDDDQPAHVLRECPPGYDFRGRQVDGLRRRRSRQREHLGAPVGNRKQCPSAPAFARFVAWGSRFRPTETISSM